MVNLFLKQLTFSEIPILKYVMLKKITIWNENQDSYFIL